MAADGVVNAAALMTETDWNSLEKLRNDVFEEFVDTAFSFLTESSKGDLLISKTEDIAGRTEINVESATRVLKSLIYVATSGIKLNRTPAQFQNYLKKSGLSDEKVDLFAKKWESHHAAISKRIAQTLTINRLVDMEWKFGVTAASSESNRVGHTFLQLKLVVSKGDRLENVYMELTLPQFYAFLHEMERAKASMEYFS